MSNLSTESSRQPFAADEQTSMRFRETLRAQDPQQLEQLAAAAAVFNAEEIAIARYLVERALQSGDSGYYFMIADGPSGPDGYTCYGPIEATDRRYELYWIVTATGAQRRGLARLLLETTEMKVRVLGGTHLFTETSTRADYIPARAFYAAMGYERHAVVPDYHGDDDGLAIFGKRL
jgi:GNAT superfamily N-acetyltransferase